MASTHQRSRFIDHVSQEAEIVRVYLPRTRLPALLMDSLPAQPHDVMSSSAAKQPAPSAVDAAPP